MEAKRYSHENYESLVNKTTKLIRQLSKDKGGEYAGDSDRLANFRRNAERLGLNMETVWAVYAGKHWDAIQQYVQDLNTGTSRTRTESISGRADDLIVYLILFKAMIEEREGETKFANDIVEEWLAPAPEPVKITYDACTCGLFPTGECDGICKRG